MTASLERALDRVLKIRPGEAPRVALMALYAANAIGAVVVGRTVRDTLFLAHSPLKDLPYLYIVNAIAVVLASWVYARMVNRVRRDRLNSIVAAGWSVAMLVFFFAAHISMRITAPLLYVAVEAMGSLVVIQFWTFAQDVFTSREAKRLFPVISAGGQAASVLSGLLASGLAATVSAESLLILCSLNLAACAFLARAVGRKWGVSPAPEPRKANAPHSGRVLVSRHLLIIALIAIVSAIAVNLVDFQFKVAVEQRFFSDKQALGVYFGGFYALCAALALILQTGVTGRVIERLGVLAALLPLPIGLMAGSALGWLFPGPWTVTLAKGTDSIFRYTSYDASLQILYVPVPARQRARAKALIDGILRPLAGIIAGGALLVLGFDTSRNGVIAALILVLCACWIVLMYEDRREYVQTLLETLQKRRLDPQADSINTDQFTTEAIVKVLRSNDPLAILYALELLQHVRGRNFGPAVVELLDHRVASVRAAAADYLAATETHGSADKLRALLSDRDPWCVASAMSAICALEHEKALPLVRPFLKDPRPAMRAAAVVGLVRHCGVNGVVEAADELKRLLNAEARVERELAASVLGALGIPNFNEALLHLLEDRSPEVRRAALDAAGKLKSPELVTAIVKQLAHPHLSREAARALAAFGPAVQTELSRVIRDPAAPEEIKRGCIGVLGRIGTQEASDLLHVALDFSGPSIRDAAARALVRIRRRRNEMLIHRDVITRAVESELQNAEHCAEARVGLRLPLIDRHQSPSIMSGQEGMILLATALEEERQRAVQRVIVLLDLLHPGEGLDLVAENLQSDSPSRRANAAEVLDNTLPEALKKRLLRLVEHRVPEIPRKDRTPAEWLDGLISGPIAWIAACAAQAAREQSVTEVVPALRQGLKSPDGLVREACGDALTRLAPADIPLVLELLRYDPSKSARRVAERLMPAALQSA